MAIASIVFGILSLIGFLMFFLGWGGLIYWIALAFSAIAAVLGYIARDQPLAKIGMLLGIIGVLIGAAMFLWLTF
jgi:hypothetical protein